MLMKISQYRELFAEGHTSEKMSEHYLDGHDYTTIEE